MSLDTKVPDFRDVIETPETFSRLIEERTSLKAQIEEMEERIEQIDDAITQQMTDAGVPKVQYGDIPVTLVPGTKNTINKTRLVELGVSVSTIEEATKTTNYHYVLVGKPKEWP